MYDRLNQFLRQSLPYIFLATLILWGGYTLFYFLGVDGHIVVLTKQNAWEGIAREVSSPFWRGVYAFVPYISLLLERLTAFLWYAVICLLLYIAYITYTVLRHGRMFIDLRLNTVSILLLGVGSLWLLATTMFYADIPGMQPRLLIEPKQEVYDSAGPETLQALQDNFHRLEEGGCLTQDTTRHGPGDARVFYYKGICMQKAFVAKVLSQLGMLLILLLDFLVLGSAILWLLRLRPHSKFVECVMSIGLGAAGMTAALWLLALFHVLNMSSAWIMLLLIPALGTKFTVRWLRASWMERWRVTTPFFSLSIFLAWVLITYIAFNYFTVIRPFPIGWDDLGRYINAPRQLSVFNQILPQIPAMQWEYLTSLGFLLFGYFSTFGATLAQLVNWLSGIFAILAIYLTAKIVLGPRAGLLASLFYYTLPMVGHFSFADMKTENALFFYAVLGLVCVLLYAFRNLSFGSEEHANIRWLFLGGVLLAAGFATKATMILLFLSAGIILTFAELGAISGIGAMILSMLVLLESGTLSFAAVMGKINGVHINQLDTVMAAMLALSGILFLLLPFLIPLQKSAKRLPISLLKRYSFGAAMLVAGFLAFSAPWMGRNLIANGSLHMQSALKAPNDITPWIRYVPEEITKQAPPGSRSLPPELQPDLQNEMCKSTAVSEELDRYWGYGSGVMHYLGLPWRVVMNKDSQGYYLTSSPLLLLIPLLLLLPFFWHNKHLRYFFYATILYVVQWILVANGIPWYGIGMFLGLAIFVEAIATKSSGISARVAAGILVALAISTSVSLRMWQFGMQQNLYEYAWGKASYEVLREMTIPDYDDIADDVMELSQNPEAPYLYRMGTFISYFIPRNLEVITLNDNQLEFFNCLNQEEDHQLTLRRLRALGFHSIVFDTNTATIEKDSNGTLHKKVERFIAFANDSSLDIIPVVNNPAAGIAYMILPDLKEPNPPSSE